mgnify:FL=1|tara:strand:- start:30920 stop:33472 length:2553 start_codon:yes stop_codon:yes gene_type:complete
MKFHMRNTTASKAALSLALVSAMVASPVSAQDTADADSDNAQRSGGLGVIVVTAQRKAESLQDAAIPINAATGDELALAGVTDATALNKIAPALYTTAGGGANAGYFIRGVGNFTNNGYTNPAVAFNIDGVYIGRPSSTIASFLDVAVVEVLKGPQGTLYGRNATGGAVNVIPTKPQLGEFSGNVSAGYGNYDAFNIEGAINVPIADSGALRVAATVNQHDGYNSDGTFDAKDFAIRGQFYAEPSDYFNFRMSMDYSTQKGVGAGTNIQGVYNIIPPVPALRANQPVNGWRFDAAPAAVSDPYSGLHTPAADAYTATIAGAPLHSPYNGDYVYPFRNDKYFGVNVEMNFDLGGVDLAIIPAYRHSKLDNQFNGPPFKAAINQDTAEQFSVEARLSGSTGPLDWILGGYYFDETVEGMNSFNQFATLGANSYISKSESAAVFARATYNVTDSLRIVGGIRYTDESRDFEADAVAVAGVCLEEPVGRAPFCPQVPTIPVGLTLQDSLSQFDPALFPARPISTYNPNGPNGVGQVFPYGPFNVGGDFPPGPGALLIITPNRIEKSGGDGEFTFRAAVEYDITPDNLLYASFENGFRAGGFNASRGNEEYAPEFIDAFTIGSKNRFFDNRLELNVELFYWKYEGQQLAALGVDIDGNNSFYTRNVGESSIKGADIDFQFLATETTKIRGGVQYLDATYDSYMFNQTDLADPGDPPELLRPVTTCDATQDLATDSYDIDCSGKAALNSPKWSANIGIEQTVEFGNLRLIGSVDGRYRGAREVGFNYIPESRIGSDFTMDAALTLGDIDDRWTLTGYVRNLTNEAVLSVVQLGAGNVVGANYQPPRTYGVRAKFNF